MVDAAYRSGCPLKSVEGSNRGLFCLRQTNSMADVLTWMTPTCARPDPNRHEFGTTAAPGRPRPCSSTPRSPRPVGPLRSGSRRYVLRRRYMN